MANQKAVGDGPRRRQVGRHVRGAALAVHWRGARCRGVPPRRLESPLQPEAEAERECRASRLAREASTPKLVRRPAPAEARQVTRAEAAPRGDAVAQWRTLRPRAPVARGKLASVDEAVSPIVRRGCAARMRRAAAMTPRTAFCRGLGLADRKTSVRKIAAAWWRLALSARGSNRREGV